MDQRVRIMVAAGIFLAGLLLAMLLSQPAARVASAGADSTDPLVLRKQAGPAPAALQPGHGATPTGAAEPTRMAPTVLTPQEGAAPPDLARSYPAGAQSPPDSRWGVSMGAMPSNDGRGQPAATHKIVDGDSLAALAQRYLGSADRAAELFEANHDVLSHPQLLPIGETLKIPPKQPAAAPASNTAPSGAMVPVSPGPVVSRAP
jgi:nucleoid-associated protein YgaU